MKLFIIIAGVFALNVLLCASFAYTGDYHLAVLSAFGALYAMVAMHHA